MQSLTRSLQERQLEVVCALANVSVVKNLLQVFRNEGDSKNSVWFQVAKSIAKKLDVTVKKIRTCLRQTNRANTTSDTLEEYFKKVISILILNHLLKEMESIFTDLHKPIELGLMLVPSKVHKLKNIGAVFTYFLDNIPSSYSLNAEINQWQAWHSNKYH